MNGIRYLLILTDQMDRAVRTAGEKGFDRKTIEVMEGFRLQIAGMRRLIDAEEDKGELEKWLNEEVDKIVTCCRSGDEGLVKGHLRVLGVKLERLKKDLTGDKDMRLIGGMCG